MVIVGIVKALLAVVAWFLSLLPDADTVPFSAAVGQAATALKYAHSLDVYVPFSEGLTAFGVFLAIYLGIQTAGFIRRVFSLLWPGAGS